MGRFITCGCGLIAVASVCWAISQFIPRFDSTGTSLTREMDLEVFPLSLTFGKVPYRGTAEKTIKLTNRASYPIRIHSIGGSCGCLRVQFKPRTLEPSQSMDVSVLMKGDDRTGLSGGRVEIYSNSATNARTVIPAQASDIIGIATMPDVVDFGRIAGEKLPLTMPFKVLIHGMPSTQRKNVRVIVDHFRVRVGKISFDSNGDAILDIQLIAGESVGHLHANLRIDVPGFDTLHVTVVAVIEHSVRAYPPTLLLTAGESKSLKVRNQSGESITIQTVEFSESLREMVQGRPTEGQMYEFVSRWSSASHAVTHGTIELMTVDPEVRISVPVTVLEAH